MHLGERRKFFKLCYDSNRTFRGSYDISRDDSSRAGALGPGMRLCHCQRPGNGGPQTCLPAAHGVAPPATPYVTSSPANIQDLREGPSLARRATQDLLGSGLTRLAHEGRRDQGKGTSRGSYDVSCDDQGQAGTSAHSVLVSSLLLKGQAQARSPGASGKGFHIGATRPRPPGRQDEGHRGAQDGVTTRAFGRRRPPLVRITCTSCLPLNLAVVASLPAQYLGRGPGPL